MPCPHDMPSAAACVDCMLDGPVAPPPVWAKVGVPFDARHESTCPCDRPIVVGTGIQRWDLGSDKTVYAHIGCVPS